MDRERWNKVNELFHAAVGRGAEQRSAFLAEACAGDVKLHEEVEALVAAHARAGEFIQRSAFTEAVEVLAGREAEQFAVGQQLGAYRIIREIGRGGMGAVYLAERADAEYEKRVAIKLIKRGMDTDAVLRRFRQERQILAALDHPHIARLLDGGTTADGLPFFVMEYVEGLPVDQFCDERKLNVTERLDLFRQVCAAVSYAHQRLVVHRDLKPSNILVTADGGPKLLDFGVAKIMHAGDEVETLQTATGLRLLTPEYASPEQLQGTHVTTLSDIYSLGVVLYELLSGQPPYRFTSRSPQDIAAAINTTGPEKPSAVVTRAVAPSDDTNKAAALVHERAATMSEGSIERLSRRLRGDLDNIVLMAMRKEPERRYASVDQFAQDIRRHLSGLPVIARRDTFSYRATKFIWRNKAANADYRRTLAVSHYNDGEILAKLDRTREALESYRQNLAIAQALMSADPQNEQYRGDVAFAHIRVGDMQAKLGDTTQALASYRQSLSLRATDVKADAANLWKRASLIEAHAKIAKTLAQMGNKAAALTACAETLALMEQTEIEPTNALFRIFSADTYTDLGAAYLSLAEGARAATGERRNMASTARDMYQRALDILEDMRRRCILSSADAANPQAIAAQLAKCVALLEHSD